MASSEGFLTNEQRETLKVASQSVEILSSSPKSPTSFLSEHHVKAPAGGKAPTAGIAVRHVRRTHSGKLVRVKKGKSHWHSLNGVDFILACAILKGLVFYIRWLLIEDWILCNGVCCVLHILYMLDVLCFACVSL